MLGVSERNSGDFSAALLTAIEGRLSEVWTAMPVVLVDQDGYPAFNPIKRTCTAQPTIKAQVEDETGALDWVKLPLLVDVLVQFPGGGGYSLTFPLKAGDEGIVVFASRCLDAWWERGGIQVQAELRMHDLSDSFFIPTVRSLPNVEAAISTLDVELRAVDPSGPAIALKSDGSVSIASPTAVSVVAPVINLLGSVVINGEPYVAHVHTGVTPGAGNSGGKL
jgi:hypothetical protein